MAPCFASGRNVSRSCVPHPVTMFLFLYLCSLDLHPELPSDADSDSPRDCGFGSLVRSWPCCVPPRDSKSQLTDKPDRGPRLYPQPGLEERNGGTLPTGRPPCVGQATRREVGITAFTLWLMNPKLRARKGTPPSSYSA